MAKQIPRRVTGSPGLSGAIKDLVSAVAKTTAPKSLTQRKARLDADIEAAQSSDSHPLSGHENDPTER